MIHVRKYIMNRWLILLFLSLLFATSCLDDEEEYTWVSIDAIQCMGNPWEQDWLEKHDDNYDLWHDLSETEKMDVFKTYYKEQGVTIYDMERTWPYETTCAACACKRGDRFYCYIEDSDVDRMLEWGFVLDYPEE
ncbi:hypothetical protein FMIA91_08180 [Fidelibacter multiformis]